MSCDKCLKVQTAAVNVHEVAEEMLLENRRLMDILDRCHYLLYYHRNDSLSDYQMFEKVSEILKDPYRSKL